MLQYFYHDSTGIIDITARCRVYRTQVKSNAEEGAVALSTLIVDDPTGDLILDPFRQIYIVETAAPTNEKVVYRGYIADREIRRGPFQVGAAREWVVQLSDPNWLINLRIIVGSDANRPAETDLARVQWLLTTTEANTFNGDDTYVNVSAGTTAMDAADYRGQNVSSILDDCAQASGKNWWVVYFEAIGQYGLWYDFAATAIYDSALSLSNTLGDVNNSTVFALSQENTTLERSPSRLVSGVYLPYDGGNVYVQNPAVGSNTIFRDAAAPSVNVKTSTKATARANRYLADNATEDDVIRTEVILPEASVNEIMHGHRVQVKATHLPGYESYTWMRVLNRTVTETSEQYLTVGLELSPLPALCEVDEQYEFSTPAGLKNLYAWEIAGIDPTPVDTLRVDGQFVTYNPDPGPLTLPGGTAESILLAGYVIANETDSDGPDLTPPNFSSSLLTIDQDKQMGTGLGDLHPETVAGHRLLTSPSAGDYSFGLGYTGGAMGPGRVGYGAGALAFVSNGDPITIVQECSVDRGDGSGPSIETEFASPLTAGNVVVVFVTVRNHGDAPIGSGIFTALTEYNTLPANNGRAGRLMYHTVECPE